MGSCRGSWRRFPYRFPVAGRGMFTKRGVVLLALAILAFVLADALDLGILYLLSTALVLIFPVTYLQVRQSSRRFAISREIAPNPCLEGSIVQVEIMISTRGQISSLVTGVDDMVSSLLEGEVISRSSSSLRGILQHEYRLSVARRGFYEIGPARATIADGFGIIEKSIRVGETDSLTVYPRYSPVDIFGGRESSEMLGVSTTGKKGASPDFLRIREYAPGDEVKTIHWRSSAKRGRLMVRELDKEETPSTLVVLNCERNANRVEKGAFEIGVRAAASVCVSALREGIEVKLVLQGEEAGVVERGGGSVQYHRVLSALAGVEAKGTLPLSMVLERLKAEDLGRGALHVVSPTLEDRDVNSIARLAARGVSPRVIVTRSLADVGDHVLRRLTGLGARVGLATIREDRMVLTWMN